MNKATHEAIQHKHPMHWELDPDSVAGRMRLIAITATYETGRCRTRVLYRTYTAATARLLTDSIVAQGGVVTGTSPEVLQERWRESVAREESQRTYGRREVQP